MLTDPRFWIGVAVGAIGYHLAKSYMGGAAKAKG